MQKINFFRRVLPLLTLLFVGLSAVWAQDPDWSITTFSGSISNNSLTINNATLIFGDFTVGSNTKGEPAVSISGGKLKFGNSKSQYWSSYSISTNYFNDKNITKVEVGCYDNGSTNSSITATQGSVTIGTATVSTTTNTNGVTLNTTSGAGGTLKLTYTSSAQASYISYIKVYYASGDDPSGPATATWSVEPASVTVEAGQNTTATITTNYDGTLSVASNATATATASIEGKVITVNGVAAGTTSLRVTGAATANYSAIDKTITVTVTEPVQLEETQWQLVTSAPTSWEGQYIIVAKPSNDSRHLLNGAQTGFSSITPLQLGATAFSESDGILTISTDVDPSFTVTESTTAGQYNIKGSSGTWLGGSSSGASFTNNQSNWVFEPKSDGKIWIRVYAASMSRAILYRNTPTFQHYATSNETANGYGSVYLYKKYESNSKTTPSLSFANPTYNATMGEAFAAPTLTKSHNVTVSYASSAEGVATVNASTGEVSLVAPGTTTITASFAGDEDYNSASASYQLVVVAAPLTTMDAIFTAATAAGSTATDCRVTFNNWVVSGVKNNNAYVTDNAGKGFIIYTSGHGFVAGDILSGTAACKVQLYNGSSELTTLTSSSEGLTVTKGGVITPITTIALASLSGVNTGAVVSYEDLEYDGTNFTDGATNLKPYNGLITLPNLISGKNYNVSGVYVQYNTTKEIAPRRDEDFELIEVINYYTVTFAETLNGTITVKNGETVINDGDEVAEGTTLTIECTPDHAENYRFQNWQYKEGEGSWNTRRTNPQDYTMPSANVQFKANFEVIPTYTVAFSVNGNTIQSENLKEGAAVTAPADPEDINGKVFTGWIETATVEGATPAYVTPITTATKTVTYYAVFATRSGSGDASLTKLGSSAAFSAGDKIAIFAKSGDNYYGLYQETVSSSYVAYYVLNHAPTVSDIDDAKKYVTLSEATNGWYLGDETNGYIYSSGSNNLMVSTEGQKTVFTIAWNSTESAFMIKYGTRWLSSRSDLTDNNGANQYKYRLGGTGGSPLGTGYLDIYLYTASNVSYSDYTTTVSAPAPEGGVINFVATTGDGKYYATFSSTRAIKFDEAFINEDETCMASVKAYAITTVDGELYRTDQYKVNNDGNYTYIPANTGVLFEYILEDGFDFDGAVPFEYADAEAEYLSAVEDNDLAPCTTAGIYKAEADEYYYYKLAYGNNTNKTNLGFYWGADEGTGNFRVKEGTAILRLPKEGQAPVRFVFNNADQATAIENVEGKDAVKFIENGTLYILRDGVRYNSLGQMVK